MEPCLIVAGSFRVTCQDALGPWAGATIAVLGGRCAERKAAVAKQPTLPDELAARRIRDAETRLTEIEKVLLMPESLEAVIEQSQLLRALLSRVEDRLRAEERLLLREKAERQGLSVVKGGDDA
jgi:hypothetical protein